MLSPVEILSSDQVRQLATVAFQKISPSQESHVNQDQLRPLFMTMFCNMPWEPVLAEKIFQQAFNNEIDSDRDGKVSLQDLQKFFLLVAEMEGSLEGGKEYDTGFGGWTNCAD